MEPFDILIVSAHPDDAEMAMGGTIAKLRAAEKRIFHLCLTRGEMGTHGSIETRKREFESANSLLGCSHEMLSLPDSGIENNRENRLIVAKVIREVRPTVVFAPYHTNNLGELGGISNVDHYTAGALVRDAVKMARLERTMEKPEKHVIQKLFFYMLPRNVLPTIIVDVTEEMDLALKAIKAYETQMAIQFRGTPITELLLLRRAALGLEIGAKYAEGFVTDMPLNFSARHFSEV